MERALKLGMALFVLLIGIGCSKEQEWTGDLRLSRPEVRKVVMQIHDFKKQLLRNQDVSKFPDGNRIRDAIYGISNVTERVALLDVLTDCLFSLDFSQLNYRSQCRAIRISRFLIEEGVLGRLRPQFPKNGEFKDEYLEWRYDILLRQLDWERKQVVRTVPRYRVEHHGFTLDPVKKAEYKGWYEIHYGGLRQYEFLLRDVEERFLGDKQDMSDVAWNRCKAKIEAYLGRPLRTPGQLADDARSNRHVEFSEKEDDYAVPLPW